REAGVSHELLLERNHQRAIILVRLRVSFCQPPRNGLNLRFGLMPAYERLQAADNAQKMHVASGRAGLCSWKLYGDPEASISSRKLESFRQDTGHDIRLIIDDYGLPDDLRTSTELSLPQALTEDRHLRLSR